MDDAMFDALTRAVSSRRTALIGGLGAIAALVGLTPATDAHDALRRCRTVRDPTRRRACQRRARAHNRKHRCRSRPRHRICAELRRCSGVAANDCGRLINCSCPGGHICLANGSCATNCERTGPLDCPEGCICVGPEVGDGSHCVANTGICDQTPQACTSTVDCPPGTFCLVGPCDDLNRCVPLCPGTPGFG